jgi:hypothetical protein
MTPALVLLALALNAAPAPAPAQRDVPTAPDLGSAHNQALLIVGGGVGLGIVSTTAFVVGLDKERELRAAPHDEKAADDILNQRTAAAWVAWPSALLSVGAMAWGGALLAMQEMQ